MSAYAFVRLKKLKARDHVLKAAKHNKREIPPARDSESAIDWSRTHLNMCIAGPPTASEVSQSAKSLMKCSMKKATLRKDAVRAVEFIFSLPPNTGIDPCDFFNSCVIWVGEHYEGNKNILSADIHMDESNPHCHVLLLPLKNGSMNGSKMVGNKAQLTAAQNAFHTDVASRYGLKKPPAKISQQGALELGKKFVAQWGCKNFCVNGQLAGNCCTPMELQINDRHERIDRQPAG